MTRKLNEAAAAVGSIFTPRLELVAVRPECLRSELRGDGQLSELLACEVTSQWPPEVWEPHVWELMLAAFAERPEETAWHRYMVLRGPRRCLIGTVNAGRWSGDPHEAELGYAVVPEFWMQGLATEAALALVSFMATSGSVQSLCAHTFPWLTASVKILERCGFRLEGPGV